MAKYIMSISARDRFGIVAALSEAGAQLGCNVEAASQTVHQGYFAMVILWSAPDDVDAPRLREATEAKAGDDLHVYVTEYRPPAPSEGEFQPFIITSIGPDRQGILSALSAYLSSKQINIDDLYACVEGGDFVVICQVSVPVGVDVFMLQADLEAVGRSLGVTIEMQHENIFVATNELPMGH